VTNIQIKEAHESFRKGGFGEVAGGVDRMDAQQMAILYDDNCGRNLSKCGTATGAARIENLGLDALINALLDAVDRVVNFFATSPCTSLDRSTDAYAALSCPAQAAQIEGYVALIGESIKGRITSALSSAKTVSYDAMRNLFVNIRWENQTVFAAFVAYLVAVPYLFVFRRLMWRIERQIEQTQLFLQLLPIDILSIKETETIKLFFVDDDADGGGDE
jgi:hypothetical protein